MLLFNRKKGRSVIAPVSGEIVALESVSDPAFSQKMLGEGVAIILNGNEVYSPISGEIVTVIPSEHAFGIRGEDGIEILVHVGLDTVNLKGDGFHCCKKLGDKVQAGEKILEVDYQYLKSRNIDLVTPIVVTNSDVYKIMLNNQNVQIANAIETVLFTYVKK